MEEDILVREIEDESVILNLNDESYYGLDDIGTHFWNVVTSSASIQSALEKLVDEYEVDESVLKKDLAKWLQTLLDKKMLKINDESI